MANKKYYEESVNYLANAIRAKLSYPNAAVGKEVNKQYRIAAMEEAIDNIPIRLGFPSAKVIKIDIPLSGYKAPANGWVYYKCGSMKAGYSGVNNHRKISLENKTKGIVMSDYIQYYNYGAYYGVNNHSGWSITEWVGRNRESFLMVPVANGDEVYVTNDQEVGSNGIESYFIYEAEADARAALIWK